MRTQHRHTYTYALTRTRTHVQDEVGAAPLGTLGYVAPERLLALRGPAWRANGRAGACVCVCARVCVYMCVSVCA